MKLYYFSLSPYSQKVMIALFEKGISVEYALIDLFSKEESERKKLEDYKKIYPLGRLPLLVDGDKLIGESTLIVEYLEKYGEKSLVPSDADLAWHVRYYSVMADNYITEPARTLFFQLQRPQEKQNQDVMSRSQATLQFMYKKFSKELERQESFLLGDDFSMADCSAWPALKLANRVYPFAQDYPRLNDYTKQLADHKGVAEMLALIKG